MAMVVKLKKSDFNAGSPYSSWLKEQIIGEVSDYKHSELIKKHNVKVFDGIEFVIMNHVGKFDDYPVEIRNMAVEIIQRELDKTFKG